MRIPTEDFTNVALASETTYYYHDICLGPGLDLDFGQQMEGEERQVGTKSKAQRSCVFCFLHYMGEWGQQQTISGGQGDII